MYLHPSKLHNRIAGVYLALLLGVQALSFWFIQDSIDGNARAAIQAELDTGEKVLLHLLDQNADSLEQATRVLSADYGFRAAVASADRATMNSALLNHSERIHADLALFTDPDFVLQARTSGKADRFLAAVQRHAAQALAGQSQTRQIEVIGGEPFQIVAVPVRAPALIGWVGMGFRVDETKLQDIRALSDTLEFGDPPVPHGLIMSRVSVAPGEQQKWRDLIDAMRADGTILRIFQKYFNPDMAQAMVNF